MNSRPTPPLFFCSARSGYEQIESLQGDAPLVVARATSGDQADARSEIAIAATPATTSAPTTTSTLIFQR